MTSSTARSTANASAPTSNSNSCGFRRLRPGIPIERGHAFRSKAATCPQRVPVLPRNHVANDRSGIGFSDVGLTKRAAQVAKVLDDDVGGDIILGVHRHDTQLQNARPRHSEDSRPAKRVDVRTVCPWSLPRPVSCRPASPPARPSRRRGLAGSTRSNTTAIDCRSAALATQVRLFTRRGYDWSGRYPAIAVTATLLRARSFTLDGEAVVCDPDGVAIFDALRRRGTVSEAMLYGTSTAKSRLAGVADLGKLTGHQSKSVRQMPRLGVCELKYGSIAPPVKMAERATCRVVNVELTDRFNDGPWRGKI